jgi:predicted hydrolase (HD superfamily)
MKVSSVRKKLKDKAFAPGVARDEIANVQDGIGLEVDEFIGLGIEGLQLVAEEIGLAG